MGPSKRMGSHLGVRARHAKGRRHPFPAMTGLAREIGDFVHYGRSRLNRISNPLSESRGERRWESGGRVSRAFGAEEGGKARKEERTGGESESVGDESAALDRDEAGRGMGAQGEWDGMGMGGMNPAT